MGSILSTVKTFYKNNQPLCDFIAVTATTFFAAYHASIYCGETLRGVETDGKMRYYLKQYGSEWEIFPDEYGNIGRGNLGTNNFGFFNYGNGNRGTGNRGNNCVGKRWFRWDF